MCQVPIEAGCPSSLSLHRPILHRRLPPRRRIPFGLFSAVVAVAFVAAWFATVVLLLTFGLTKLPTAGLERWSHALAGTAILLCGIAIHLGL